MDAPATFRGWMEAQMMPVSLLAAFLAAGLLIVVFSAWARKRQMETQRAGETLESFVQRMADYGFNTDLSRLTYIYLTEHEGVSFPIRPRDFLDEDLGLSDGDVREMLAWLTSASGRLYEPGAVPYPLVTVADVVRAVQASPMLSRLAA